jgi:predicted DNA-binding mobile mystery protein A
MKFDKLQLEQLSRKLQNLKDGMGAWPFFNRGWIGAVRQALCMSKTQLAKRAGVTRARIQAIERQEIEGTLKMNTLRKMAESLGCDLYYGFIPKKSLEKTWEDHIDSVASRRLATLLETMALEDQAVDDETATRLKRDIVAQISATPQRIWDEK